MDDRLEKFIKTHRSELDDKSPGKDLWTNIQKEIGQNKIQRHRPKAMNYWRIAAVILLLISSWLAFDKIYQPEAESDFTEIVELSPQLLEAETYYVSLIDQKRGEIKYLSEKFELGNSFLLEIDKLDSMYISLKQDIKHGNEGEIVDAMILNLQLRIEILNQQLSIIQSIENSQRNEKTIL